MALAVVEVKLDQAGTKVALDALNTAAPEIRNLPGNEMFEAYERGDGVVIVQEWATVAAFDAYRASPVFAAMGAALKPLALGVPRSRLFEEIVAPG